MEITNTGTAYICCKNEHVLNHFILKKKKKKFALLQISQAQQKSG